MTEYLVPKEKSEIEFTEKRSRFIGQIFPISSEEEARGYIDEVKARYHDARHNCWCYALKKGGVVRYSDDGEPQGTAGQPMLFVFQREGIEDVCCVVTRYFGGILLGTGGLTRAYSRAAKEALDKAGILSVQRWNNISMTGPYSFFERLRIEIKLAGGMLDRAEYGADVKLRAVIPESNIAGFIERVNEVTGGGVEVTVTSENFKATRV
jgi:uncharacterized YigZ family protein